MKLDGSIYTFPDNKKSIQLPTIYLMKQNEKGKWNPTSDTLYVDQTLFINLYRAKENAKKYNGDILYVIDGEEGSGKSTLARQIAIILDETFNHERIAYSTKDYVKMYFKHGKWRSILLDESKADLDRKRTMSKKNVWFMNFLSQAREPHHKIGGVILPSIYDLDGYIAEHRAKFLIHCYKHKGKKPGYFRFYGKKAIKELFIKGKKWRNYPVKPNFKGRFAHQQVVDLEEYQKIKNAASERFKDEIESESLSEEEIIKKYVMERISYFEQHELNMMQKEACELLGISKTSWYNYKKEMNEA